MAAVRESRSLLYAPSSPSRAGPCMVCRLRRKGCNWSGSHTTGCSSCLKLRIECVPKNGPVPSSVKNSEEGRACRKEIKDAVRSVRDRTDVAQLPKTRRLAFKLRHRGPASGIFPTLHHTPQDRSCTEEREVPTTVYSGAPSATLTSPRDQVQYTYATPHSAGREGFLSDQGSSVDHIQAKAFPAGPSIPALNTPQINWIQPFPPLGSPSPNSFIGNMQGIVPNDHPPSSVGGVRDRQGPVVTPTAEEYCIINGISPWSFARQHYPMDLHNA
ncbi:uncharacterized protein EI90DRAFT_3119223 [Cantharellus anzutake]|uniref:uncharacterized protein n=1 Tax=Cantharellus anzutake TaxID=1750568 RepID=UPI0019079955|nr:uncharacterized protein EI90DRAFT_3119223 [Cantharellus anzutake]KAF8336911.1 hypothetical protein EI90DRAFT_3119223 [Cantharellus anzutake]